MDDYYALLGVERTAAAEDLEKQIRQQLRTWSKRSNHPDLPRRQEAERRVQQYSEMRKILLDPHRRAEYDRRLALEPAASGAAAGPATDKDADVGWLAEAKRHLVGNDYLSAAYAARQARDAAPSDAAAWSVLAWANVQLGNITDALYEAGRAVTLDSGVPAYHLDLGDIQSRMNRHGDAIASYRKALELDPGLEEASVAIAGVLQDTGRHAEALRMLEDLLQRTQDKDWMGDQLAIALITAAEAVPHVQFPGGYAVTAPAEITFMRQHTDRVRQVTKDPALLEGAAGIDEHLAWCASRHWQAPRWMGNGCLIAIAVVGFIVVCSISLGVLASGDVLSILGLMIMWALGLGVAFGVIYLSGFVPGWRLNQLAHLQRIGYPGFR